MCVCVYVCGGNVYIYIYIYITSVPCVLFEHPALGIISGSVQSHQHLLSLVALSKI